MKLPVIVEPFQSGALTQIAICWGSLMVLPETRMLLCDPPDVFEKLMAAVACPVNVLFWMLESCELYMAIPNPKPVTLLYCTMALGTPSSIPRPKPRPLNELFWIKAPGPTITEIPKPVLGLEAPFQEVNTLLVITGAVTVAEGAELQSSTAIRLRLRPVFPEIVIPFP